MLYIVLGSVLFAVWGGALLALPIIQDREMKRTKAAEPQQEPAGQSAHAMA